MYDTIACLSTQVNAVAGLSLQFTNLKNWGAIAPLFHHPYHDTPYNTVTGIFINTYCATALMCHNTTIY